MKKTISIILITILMVSITMLPVESENIEIYDITEREKITKGLDYEYTQKFTNNGWVDIHVLIMDLEEDQVAMEILRSTDEFGLRKTLTTLAEDRENVVGGINGSFFNMSEIASDPLGIMYEEGYASASHNYNTGANGVASLIQDQSNRVYFDYFGISMKLTTGAGNSLYLGGINKLVSNGSPIIYNDLFGKDTSQLDQIGKFYKITVINDVVVSLNGPEELVEIPSIEEGYIISIPNEIAQIHIGSFTPGTTINLTIDSTIDTEEIKYAISGSGKVLENGVIVDNGYTVDKNVRHPRSAIGVTGDNKIIAMVVDGRGSSLGATHDEIGTYLLEYGVTDAMQLDGGGSSTLIGRELGNEEIEVQNTLSGGAQRKVLNGIGFVSLAETGDLETIEIKASATTVFKNSPVYLDVIGYDSNYNPITIDTNKIVWSVEGLVGSWGVNVFSPSNAAKGKVICYYKGLSTTIEITSLENPIDLNVTPKLINLDYNQKSSFAITGLDISGFEGSINKNEATYTLENKSIGSFINGEFVSSNTSGVSKVTIQVGDRWTTAYIAVGNEQQKLETFESVSFETRVYPDDVAVGEVTIDNAVYFDTNLSYKFSYDFVSSPDPQALYMMIDDLVIKNQTDTISLNVLGNNNGFMVKAKVKDSSDKIEVITLASSVNFTGWKEVSASMPNNLSYPITLDQLYIVSTNAIGPQIGSIHLDGLSISTRLSPQNLKYDNEGFIDDEMRLDVKPKNEFEIKVFGPTAYRNRMLDNIILGNVYDTMNEAEYGIFSVNSNINSSKLDVPYSMWENKFNDYTIEGVKFIHLGTTSGGLRTTDYTQYDELITTLKSTSENTIVIVGNRNPLKNFSDVREGELVHNILKDYMLKSGKTLMYINGGGYETDVTIKDGVRYFDLSGLWYRIEDRHISLNETFYSLNFYIKSGKVTYMIESLYPFVEDTN